MSESTSASATGPVPPSGSPASSSTPTVSRSYHFDPTTSSSWVKPGYAVVVVCVVAVALLGVIGWALVELQVVGAENAREADPNAGTIAAIASAGLSALTSLTAAYFGIKVAGEQATQAHATASAALEVASVMSANSTANGNPSESDF